jgi:hypothetical protein
MRREEVSLKEAKLRPIIMLQSTMSTERRIVEAKKIEPVATT